MSNQKCTNALLKREFPRFPGNIDSLTKAYDEVRPTPEELIKIGNMALGMVRSTQPITSDGYEWAGGFICTKNFAVVTIAFPKWEDEQQRDGTSTDRSVAIYAHSAVSDIELESFAEVLIKAFGKFKSEMANV